MISKEIIKKDRTELCAWYNKNKRALPWRSTQDPYLIWISEVMLQQTTTTAVLPFYIKFIDRFPNVKSLAQAPLEDVYTYWAGLGYYSRARNLHKSAQHIFRNADSIFPQTADELIQLPGFGPYTSRAVASFAYGEKVGVLDGNVIRILCRKYGLDIEWWKTSEKNLLQNISDQLASTVQAPTVNQAMMELGATICTPKKALCTLCPWVKTCVSAKQNKVLQRPLKKPKKAFKIWSLTLYIDNKNQKILLTENTVTPFLKGHWLPPLQAKELTKKPEKFDFKHGVTTFDIYVNLSMAKPPNSVKLNGNSQWVNYKDVVRINPTSLMKKVLEKKQLI